MAQLRFEALARSWWAVLRRSFREFQDEHIFDWVAALTYYAVLSIFPVLLAVVSFVGLIGGPAVRPMMDNFDASAPPGPANDILFTALDNLQRSRGQAFVLLVVGVAAALWAATGYVGTFRRAANEILGTSDERQILSSMWVRLGVPALVVALMTLAVVMVVFTGGLATSLGQMLGVDPTGTLVWNILKWPGLAVVVAAMLVTLYRTAPTVRRPNYRGVTPGIAVAVILWLVASALFALYLAKFSSYNQTYAAFAAVVIFLVWLWVTSGIVLLGVQFDIDLRRSHALEAGAGRPSEAEPSAESGAARTEVGRARAEEDHATAEEDHATQRGHIHPS